MQKQVQLKLLALLVTLAGLAVFLITDNFANRKTYAYSSGPPAGFTHAPGEFDCAECHLPQPDAGTGRISINAPQTYVPGQTYQLTVTHTNTDPTRLRWGFQLTALDDSNSKAGNLQPLDARTRVLDNQGPGASRQYIEHTASGTFINQQGGANWTFNWTAPATNVGPVTFYVAGNQANNDGNTSGDYVYFTFAQTQAATVQLSQGSYAIGEAGGSAQVVVSRTDATSAANVDYATSDTSGLNACSSVTTLASSRCDYATTIGTLRFAIGEATKTIYIPVIDDNIADGTETFTLTLSNPSGASLGTTTSATITITDNANSAGNPVDTAEFFIREHYIDFLGREPEPAGLAGWLNVYNNCGTTVAQPCDRIEISSAFFRSEEFQTRAYFIYRFYSAVGRIPLYEGFMPDFAKVSGFLSTQELEANKVAFVNEFMTRTDFQIRYGALTEPTAYVDALLQTVGLPNHPGRQAWVTGLTNASLTRAQVLRALVESTEMYQKYYTEAFVIMQYFGYLRRSADISYLNWIQTMNSTGGDYRTMINGFLNSAEYRQRFGP